MIELVALGWLKQCKSGHLAVRWDFYKERKARDGLTAWCVECSKARTRAWYTANKERAGAYSAQYYAANKETQQRRSIDRGIRKHGITVEQYEVMLAAQGGRCAMPGCGATEPSGHGRWHIDHNHACCAGKFSCGKCIRGLLCRACNAGLGLFGDSVDRLLDAASYLEANVVAMR